MPENATPTPPVAFGGYRTEHTPRKPLGYGDRLLLGLSIRSAEELVLSEDEIRVIEWLREEKARASSPYEISNVGVLLVGNPEHVRIVNHQLDHIGGGLVSCIDPAKIAGGRFDPTGMDAGEPYMREWSIGINMLGDRTNVVPRTEGDLTMPDLGEMQDIMDSCERTDGGVGTLALARQMLEAFPGHDLKVVSAWYAQVQTVRTVAAAEEFFATHGEWTMEQDMAMEVLNGSPADSQALLANLIAKRAATVGRPMTDDDVRALIREVLTKALESEVSK